MDLGKFLSKQLFNGRVELRIRASHDSYTFIELEVDHSLFWDNSEFFDEEYSNYVNNIYEGLEDEEIRDMLPLIGLSRDFQIQYESKNKSVYNEICDLIEEMGYEVSLNFLSFSPYAYITVSTSDDNEIEKIYRNLQSSYDYDLDNTIINPR